MAQMSDGAPAADAATEKRQRFVHGVCWRAYFSDACELMCS